MKKIFVLTTAILTSWASISFARTTYVNGDASDMGYCNSMLGSSCINSIKTSAEREAQRQAEWNCRMSQGTPLSYTNFCSSFCSPNVVVQDNTMVRCSSSCRMQCEVAN